MNRLTANELRKAFTSFFAEKGHTVVPSASLIPHDPDLMFTVAGMVPFKPYFLGEEKPPFTRATTVQKCVRAGGKDSDLEEVGRDTRHLSFFEMLGNFSFGDYFKAEAIPMAWDMVTNLFGIDPELLWVTCHHSDNEAAELWRDVVGVRPERIQFLDADNWWGPPGGPPGPCGPCSEIYVDKGPAYGPDGGPAGGGDERFLEIWNLVFMQFARDVDGTDTELPKRNIDTGAGLERILGVLQGKDSVFDTDVLAPLVETAQSITGVSLGQSDRSDISIRILAEHARTMSFLVGDGVFPSNEGRGYVLRRIIRRAVREAYLLGVEKMVTPVLVDTTVAVMGEAYPDLAAQKDFVQTVVTREEEKFRATLKTGTAMLDTELAGLDAGATLSGSVAFILHDTHGFPLELTREITLERGHDVDIDGFDQEMEQQRSRAKAARKGGGGDNVEFFADIARTHGPTVFFGGDSYAGEGKVLAVTEDSIVVDRTPFYAESGGQVGDTGEIRSETGRAIIIDTVYGAPGVVCHKFATLEGEIETGSTVLLQIDGDRRDAIRRNHTATHLLHWALREVLGDHVKQQGSLVTDERLRFDFSHYDAVSDDEIRKVEDLIAADILANEATRHFETSMDEASAMGAIAFFGDKYGDVVKVLQAGPHSIELCGGTHVRALGDIGPVKIVSESSIGSNIRRIEAVSGLGPLQRLREDEAKLRAASDVLGVATDELVDTVVRRVAEIKELRQRVRELELSVASNRAVELAANAENGIVIARLDDLERDALRDLAVAVRDQKDIQVCVLGSAPAAGGVALACAVRPDSGYNASALIADAAKLVKGGGGKHAEIAVAGGKDPSALDEALAVVRTALL